MSLKISTRYPPMTETAVAVGAVIAKKMIPKKDDKGSNEESIT